MVIWEHERWRIVRIASGRDGNLYALEQYTSDGRRIRRDVYAADSDTSAISQISWRVRRTMGDVKRALGGGEE